MRLFFLSLLLSLLLCFEAPCFGNAPAHPFDYDLCITTLPGKSSRTMICMHGYGANHKISQHLKSINLIDATLVSFNFPDYDIKHGEFDPSKASFGTIKELLPALYVIKKHVIDDKQTSIDLYGFSAGGGALINLIAILNTQKFDAELSQIGIGSDEKKLLLNAIQNGMVILDVPLKSLEEIIEIEGSSKHLEVISKNYRENNLRPIDSLAALKDLKLDIILHFQEKDEVLYNRDDPIYIERLKKANHKGTTAVIIGNDGGHSRLHHTLWKFYAKKMQDNSPAESSNKP